MKKFVTVGQDIGMHDARCGSPKQNFIKPQKSTIKPNGPGGAKNKAGM